jgi:hypothetical protein
MNSFIFVVQVTYIATFLIVLLLKVTLPRRYTRIHSLWVQLITRQGEGEAMC